MNPIKRRTLLKAASSSVALGLLPSAHALETDPSLRAEAKDPRLAIGFDQALRTSIRAGANRLTGWEPSESLLLKHGSADAFDFVAQRTEALNDAAHGTGRRTIVTGRSAAGLEKEV